MSTINNEKHFKELCHIMANVESLIDMLEDIGFMIADDDDGVGHNIYNTASRAYDLASDLLEFPDVQTENDVCNQLLAAKESNVEKVATEVWDKYGKRDI